VNKKITVLFLCTGNSCRSQMAEGFCRHLKSDSIDCASAGIETHGLNPNAVRVMAETGIDISSHISKTVADLGNREFDYVITVCGHASETCPYFPARTAILHRGFDDPPKLAANASTEEEALDCYRYVRDEIGAFINSLPEAITQA
jgi:arsenate reductase